MSSKLSYGLLLDDVKGYRRLSAFVNKDQLEGEITHKVVLKGSLLVQLDKTTIKAFKEILSCIVNYMVYTIPSTEVYVMVGSHKVRTITNEQRDFLYGIEGLSKRLEVYKRLGWIEKLTEGSEVYVTITTTPYPVKGVVRWIGKLAGEYGTKFGIELLVCTYELCMKYANRHTILYICMKFYDDLHTHMHTQHTNTHIYVCT